MAKKRKRGGSISLRGARRGTGGPQAMVPRPKKLIPNADAAFAMMADSFANTIASNPDRYGVHEDDAKMLTRRAKEYRDALQVALGDGSRTAGTILAKDAARKTAEELIRAHANLIRADPSIERCDKVVLNIKERPKRLGRRRCPKSMPVLRYVRGIDAGIDSPARHVLTFREKHVDGHAKPLGAARLDLYFEMVPPGGMDGERGRLPKHPAELSGWPKFLRSFTRTPMDVEIPMPSEPMLFVYWGRWADASGEVGPWSETCVARIEGSLTARRPALPGDRAMQCDPARRVETKYVFIQAPYLLPGDVADEDGRMQGIAGDERRRLDAA